MKKLSAICCLTMFSLSTICMGEPQYAYRNSLKCSACHVNHTGGAMRSDYGKIFSHSEVSPLLETMTDENKEFSSELTSGISIGTDFVANNETQFSYKENGYKQKAQNFFDISTGNLYISAQLIPEKISLYFDENVTPSGASSREAFILLEKLPGEGYVKIGRMFVPFGIGVRDNATYVRRTTGFNYENQDIGLQFGFEPHNASINVSITNGKQGGRDDNMSKQVSTTASFYLPNTIVGGSFAINESRGIDRVTVGPYGAWTLGALTLMGEIDWIKESGHGTQNQLVAFGSMELWLRESINARIAFDFLDPFDNVPEDEKSRLSIGFDAFLSPELVADVHFRLKNSIPQDPTGNSTTVTTSLRAFF